MHWNKVPSLSNACQADPCWAPAANPQKPQQNEPAKSISLALVLKVKLFGQARKHDRFIPRFPDLKGTVWFIGITQSLNSGFSEELKDWRYFRTSTSADFQGIDEATD